MGTIKWDRDDEKDSLRSVRAHGVSHTIFPPSRMGVCVFYVCSQCLLTSLLPSKTKPVEI